MKRPLYPHHLLAYVVSIPERIVRSLATLLGVVGLALTRLLPKPIREGKFYRLAVERQIRILTDDVGGAGLFPGEKAVDAKTATRMAVGGAVDNLMMVAMHASPMWILFAATDVSSGARAYVRELAEELKDAGVMEEGSRLDSVDDVLGGLAKLSDKLADTVDMPPLSVEDMKGTIAAVGSELKSVGETAIVKTAALDGLAKDLTGLAKNANHSLLETTGAVALGSMRGAGNIIKGGLIGAGTTVRFVGRVVWQDVLGDYGRTIRRIYRRGFYGAIRGFLRPQLRSWRTVYAYRYVTFIEIGLSLGVWRKAPWRLQA